MGVVLKLFLFISAGFIAFTTHKLLAIPPLPELEDTWWGSTGPTQEDNTIKPFKINVSDQVLQDLNERLLKSREFTPPLEGTQHQYGINTNLLRKIVDYWRTKYNWREREKFLNQYPQFTVNVQGLRLHYIHVKPKNTKNLPVMPLLLLHGFPGSVREFYELIPLLTTPQEGRDFVFEVVVASLPGYGFSEAATKPGLGAIQMAVVFKNFMKKIGFDKYYIQGGDWGAIIVQNMATLYPEHILGVHSNICFLLQPSPLSVLKLLIGSFYPSMIVSKEHQNRIYPLSDLLSFNLLESGYLHIQATKPDTVGVGLNDSPVGLAAYILEKFITWTNISWKNVEDGNLTKKFSYDALLDNVMIYWVTNSITTSVRLYAETFNKAQFSLGVSLIPTKVPAACSRFRNEIAYQPTSIIEEKFQNLVQITDYDDGGHFAAFEVPNVLAKDIYNGVEKMVNSNQNINKLN